MFADEKRQMVVIIGVFIAVCVVVVAVVLVFDVRSLVQNNLPAVQEAVDETLQEALPVRQPQFDENGEYIITEDEFRLPGNMLHMGQVKRGMEIGGSIGLRRTEGWTLAGVADETYLLDFDPLTSAFIWEMAVYGPDEMLLALTADSDAGYADFTQLQITLPVAGTYYIVLRAFGPDGKYGLHVE